LRLAKPNYYKVVIHDEAWDGSEGGLRLANAAIDKYICRWRGVAAIISWFTPHKDCYWIEIITS